MSIKMNYFLMAFQPIAVLSTIFGLIGITIRDIFPSLLGSFLILVSAYVLFLSIVRLRLFVILRMDYKTKIRGNKVTIKVADIFEQDGLKLIPFNEYFDTQVDDVVIAHKSLNGKFIDEYCNVEELNDVISSNAEKSEFCSYLKENRLAYPLGRIIQYNDYLLLAFTHFDQNNRAYIDVTEYEACLLRMWKEIRRVNAGRHIYMPLIGSGITDIDGICKKDNTELLKCILCSLKNSSATFPGGITIVLTRETRKTVDMNEIRSLF